MDNFRVIYKILSYLEKAMDYNEPDMDFISADALKISEQRWAAIMEMLAENGYIEGLTVKRALSGETLISMSRPRITLRGIEYLHDNSLMAKAARAAKNIADIAT